MSFFSRGSRRQVGIDVGTSSIKAVELKQEGSDLRLGNYGVMYGLDLVSRVAQAPTEHAAFTMSESEMAAAVKKLLSFSGIKTDKAIFPIPIFSSFLTIITLPFMEMEELDGAVSLQARTYIPVPLEEVVLDWLAIPPSTGSPTVLRSSEERPDRSASPIAPSPRAGDSAASPVTPSDEGGNRTSTALLEGVPSHLSGASGNISVLLVAIPREVIHSYQSIARLAGLEVQAVESESFSMLRSLVGSDPATIIVIDLGARSTTLTVIDQGFVRMSHTVDLSGKELTNSIAKSLNISAERAEKLKKKEGLEAGPNTENITQVLTPAFDKLTGEYKKMTEYYRSQAGRTVSKVVLSGGSSRLPGLKEYLAEHLGVVVLRGNPFERVQYPKELAAVLTGELAPHLAVAAGAAMRDFE